MTPARPPRPPQRRHILIGAAGSALGALTGCSKTEPVPPAAPSAAAPAPAFPGAAPAPPAPSGSGARTAFDTASRGNGFVVGQAMAVRQMLVFFDPQCSHCAALWEASRPLRDRVRMVWMPVAFLTPASAPQGALLLAAPAAEATATMDRHEALLATGKGGLPVAGPPDAELLAKVKANTELWRSLGADSVPHLVYRAGADGPFGVESGGLPTDQLLRLLAL